MRNQCGTGLVSTTAAPRNIERLLGDVFDSSFGFVPQGRSSTYPALNVWGDDAAYFVAADLPGFERENIDISVIGKVLKLSGKREFATDENAQVFRSERHAGEFERTLRFPVELDSAQIEAKYENGVLSLRLPKAAAALPRKIEIQG